MRNGKSQTSHVKPLVDGTSHYIFHLSFSIFHLSFPVYRSHWSVNAVITW